MSIFKIIFRLCFHNIINTRDVYLQWLAGRWQLWARGRRQTPRWRPVRHKPFINISDGLSQDMTGHRHITAVTCSTWQDESPYGNIRWYHAHWWQVRGLFLKDFDLTREGFRSLEGVYGGSAGSGKTSCKLPDTAGWLSAPSGVRPRKKNNTPAQNKPLQSGNETTTHHRPDIEVAHENSNAMMYRFDVSLMHSFH